MALIAIAADKGSPGVTTTSVALAAVWPRPVLLAECDPSGGDLVYRLPGSDGERLDPRRGLLSLAVAARRGLQPHQVWEHVQKLRGGLDVLAGVTSAEHGAGLEGLWGSVGAVLSALPQADVIADCGRIGVDGPYYDLLARATAVVMISRATLGEVIRLRERAVAVAAALQRRGRPGARLGVVVIAGHKHFNSALAEVARSLDQGKVPASVIGGLADEPKSADLLRGEWGGKLDKSLLIRTAREIAAHLAAQLPAEPDPQPRAPGESMDPRMARPRGPAVPDGRRVPGSYPPAAAAPQVESAAPARSEPARPEPVRSEPARPEPVRFEPARPEPVRPELSWPEPVRSEPAQPESDQPESAQPESAQPGSDQPEPVRPEPVRPGPVLLGPVRPEPAHAEAAKPELVRPEVAWPEPFQAEAAWPEPVRSEPVRPETAWPYPDPGGWPDPVQSTGPLADQPRDRHGRYGDPPGVGGDA